METLLTNPSAGSFAVLVKLGSTITAQMASVLSKPIVSSKPETIRKYRNKLRTTTTALTVLETTRTFSTAR